MPTSKSRLDRINEEMMRELSGLLRAVKDPRLSGYMLSVLRCEVTNDLRWCKVYLSVLGDYDEKALKAGLKSSAGFLRSELAKRVNLRATPELTFVLDNSIAHGAKIAGILNTLDIKPDEERPEDDEQSDAE